MHLSAPMLSMGVGVAILSRLLQVQKISPLNMWPRNYHKCLAEDYFVAEVILGVSIVLSVLVAFGFGLPVNCS
jgi:hypothetical protein